MRVTAITRYKHGSLFSLLRKVGWSQAELARRMGVSPSGVGRIINLKERPTRRQADLMQKAFAEAGEFFDVLEMWPETFSGFGKRSPVLEQTRDVDLTRIAAPTPRTLDLDAGELRKIHAALERLTPIEREVIELRFFEGLTLKETAEKIGCYGPERARQVESRALRRLRHPAGGLHGLAELVVNF